MLHGPDVVKEEVATEVSLAGVPAVVDQYASCPCVSPVEVARYEISETVPEVVIVPPFKPSPAVIDETVAFEVLQVAHDPVTCPFA